MKNIAKFRTIPEGSILTGFERIDYCDSFRIPLPENQTVDQITTRMFRTRKWVTRLMNIRNAVVKVFGLKTGKGNTVDADYYPIGSRAVYFTVIDRNDQEIVMGEQDKHLDFMASVFTDRENGFAYMTTVVRFNNWWGRLYFIPVKPFHGIIIKSSVKQALDN